MTALQRTVAKLQALIEDAPECFFILVGRQRHINEVDSNNTLIEASVILRLAIIVFGIGDIVPAIAGTVRSQEAAASHAGIHIAVSFCFAFGQFVLAHFLFTDIIRNHTASGTFCCHLREVEERLPLLNVIVLQNVDELRERRSDIHADLVLYAFVALTKHFFDAQSEVVLQNLVLPCFVQVHEHRDERSLPVGGHQSNDLILNRLDTGANFFAKTTVNDLVALILRKVQMQLSVFLVDLFADGFTADINKFGKMGQADALTTVLAGGHLCDNLCGDVASGREPMRALNQSAGNHCTVLQHVIEVEQVAVVHMLGIVISIVEMDDARVVSFYDVLRQQHTHGQIFTDFTGHVVALYRHHLWILVRVFLLDLFVSVFDEGKNLVICGIVLAHCIVSVAILDVGACDLVVTAVHQDIFHNVLYFLHGGRVTEVFTCSHSLCSIGRYVILRKLFCFRYAVVGFSNGNTDFLRVEFLFLTGTLDDTHIVSPFIY